MERSSASPPSPAQQRLRDAAETALAHLREPKSSLSQADIAHAMDRVLGRWLDRYFIRKGRVPEVVAEELTAEVWIKLLRGSYVVHSNAFALVCKAAHDVLVDHVRRNESLKHRTLGRRGAPPSETAIDESLEDMVQNVPTDQLGAHELRDCLQKMWHVFATQHPARAELIEYLWEGLSYQEIALLLFGEVAQTESKTYVARVRNRVEEARKQAKPHFQECLD